MERNDEPEAAIRSKNRDDSAPYLVYADWLQARGEPLGELIVLQHARDTRGDDTVAAAARRKSLGDQLGLPDDKLVQVDWHWGLWRGIKLANSNDWMNEGFDPIALAREVFGHPACAALDHLFTGVLRWDYNHRDIPAVIAEAGKFAWAKDLRKLHLGDLSDVDVDMDHHVIGDVGAAITRAFPGLEDLVMHSGSQSWRDDGETFGVAGLALPKLRVLTVETCAMTTARLEALIGAKLPALDTLELWFGSNESNAAYALADLTLLLSGERLPTVRHLGLRNSDSADTLATMLVDRPIAARLESLDLSMGTMSDDGARALAAGAARFPKLERLVVDANFLTPDGIALLSAAFKEVSADEQKEDDVSIPGEVHRYVSVHE